MKGGHMEIMNRVEDLIRWLLKGDTPKDATDG
jgi:hypothetical protein